MSTVAGRLTAGSRGQQYTLITTLFVAMCISSVPTYALGVLAPALMGELHLGEAVFGLVTAGSHLTGVVVARGLGHVFDGLSGRMGLTVVYLASAACLAMLSATTSPVWFVGYAITAGVAIGINNPVTNRLIARHIAPGRQGTAIAVKQTGVKLGQMLAGALIPALALTIGWRRGLVFVVAAAMVLFVASLPVLPRATTSRPAAALRGRPTHSSLVDMRWLQHYSTAMGIGMSSAATYLTLYAVEHMGLPYARGGLLISVFAGVGMIARLLWATVAQRLAAPARALVPLSTIGAGGFALIAAGQVVGEPMLWIGTALAGATIGSWTVIVHLTVVREVPAAQIAASTGRVHAGFVTGLALGAPAFGLVVSVSGSYAIAWLLNIVLCIVALAIASREIRRRGAKTADPSVSGSTGPQ